MGGWAQVIGTGTKLLGNIIGGAQARGGVKRAGTVLQQGYGNEAANALLMPETVNPGIGEAYSVAGRDLSNVANRSGDDLIGAGRTANEYLNPYVQGGGQAFQTLSDLAQAPEERFTGTNLEMDPGYAFRQSEAMKAIERSAAARGIGQTGGTLKALTRYGQDMASQEYQNAFNRSLEGFKANQSSRQQRLGTLSGLANMGYGAAGASGQNLVNTQQTAGGWRNQAAQQQGQWGIEGQNRQADIAMRYADLAQKLRLGGVQSEANSILGSSGITADMWAGGGTSLGDLISSNPFGKKSQGGWGGGSSPQSGGYTYDWTTGQYR
jgi:hypothetical protein